MIKTKLFTGYFSKGENGRQFIDIDAEMNQFFQENKDIEFINIKYGVVADVDGEAWHSALLIYK
ncbi:sporulation protein Cse60 [Bacillus atrophaeus]|uniref:sporulation protein Cse60 n=1 Tax=Bacillus atrophaeus TaxID=1452 RepID=UPI00228245DB|nr:sporulation protein Cse60 [Bacillus atrophaeus]MCY8513772.1 sporulation protein Cse60 [Bacillus atrophaeus]MCY8993424.1 sporulation protein Cse60 [Bacillus atrophaeus]